VSGSVIFRDFSVHSSVLFSVVYCIVDCVQSNALCIRTPENTHRNSKTSNKRKVPQDRQKMPILLPGWQQQKAW